MGSFKDRTGIRYGWLLAQRRDTSRSPASGGRRVYWWCKCDCGAEISVSGHDLQSGCQRSCGCMKYRWIAEARKKHGHSHNRRRPKSKGPSPTYSSWMAAKMRCSNPASPKFSFYGGRGIRMCQDWMDSFERFLADMGERPPHHTLDRINSDGDYEPGNCRWASHKLQANNRRGAILWRMNTSTPCKRSLSFWHCMRTLTNKQ